MSVSRDERPFEAEAAHHADQDDHRAGDDHVAAARRHHGERRPLRGGHRGEPARTRSAVSTRATSDGVGPGRSARVRARSPGGWSPCPRPRSACVLHGRERRPRPRRGPRRPRGAIAWRSAGDGGSDVTCRSVRRTLPIRVEVAVLGSPRTLARRRARSSHRRCRAPGTAAGRTTDRARGSPPEERQSRLALARDHLELGAGVLADRGRVPLAVRRIADGARRRDADPLRVQRSGSARVRERGPSIVRSNASGSNLPVRSTPRPRRVMTRSRASSVGSPPAAAGGSSDEQADRVGPLVDRGHATAHARPAWTGSTWEATSTPTGSSPPARWNA